jgi:hypothetical protein
MSANENSITSIIPGLSSSSASGLSGSTYSSSSGSSSGSDFPSSPSGLLDKFKSMGIMGWVIVILILAFLGVNVFAYLARGTQEVTGIFGPVAHFFSNAVRAVTGQTLAVSAEGGKALVNTAANVTNTGLSGVQQIGEAIVPNGASTSLPTSSPHVPTEEDNASNNAINRVLNSAKARQQELDYHADEANSTIQGGGKGGWCYIGEDRGFRSCASVTSSDICMSGEIFPSQEICINPSLRP